MYIMQPKYPNYNDGILQKRHKSIAHILKLCPICIKPWIYCWCCLMNHAHCWCAFNHCVHGNRFVLMSYVMGNFHILITWSITQWYPCWSPDEYVKCLAFCALIYILNTNIWIKLHKLCPFWLCSYISILWSNLLVWSLSTNSTISKGLINLQISVVI